MFSIFVLNLASQGFSLIAPFVPNLINFPFIGG